MRIVAFVLVSVALTLAGTGFERATAQDSQIDIGASAVQAFGQYCYEPNRRGGRAREPLAVSGWRSMPEAMRARFGIPDNPALDAWLKPGPTPEDLLLLQIHERRLDKAGVHSGQMRISCRVVAVSADLEPESLHAGLEQIIGSPAGSRRPDVLANLGYPTPDGWEQACWTVLTRLEDTDWQAYEHDGRPTCVYLTTPQNYAVSQYVVVRLLSRNSGGTAILEFDRTLRPDALKD